MKLYYSGVSSRSRRVRALIADLDLQIEQVAVDLGAGEQRQSEFLAMNPNGLVPVLVDGDFVLWESAAILQYLASLKPTPLYPDDVQVRADIARWLFWTGSHLEQATNIFLFENIVKGFFGLGEPSPEALEKGNAEFAKHGGTLDSHLTEREWMVGAGPSVADYMVAGSLFWHEYGKVPVSDFEHVYAWLQRVTALPGWKKTEG